jgi:hypothetical protein
MTISPGPSPDEGRLPAHPAGRGGDGDEVRTLVRAQLRAALITCAVVLAVMVGLPLLPVLALEQGWGRPYGIPLRWMGLAFAAQPMWVVLGLWHLRRAERIERAFLARRASVDGVPVDAEPGMGRTADGETADGGSAAGDHLDGGTTDGGTSGGRPVDGATSGREPVGGTRECPGRQERM